MRLLVIEDNRDHAANLADFFEPIGYGLDFAYSGAAGLELAVKSDFDLIILDVNLGDMNGFEVCRQLRAQHSINTPILFLTARDGLDDKLEGFSCGASDYLVKPFSMLELQARINAQAKRPAPIDQSVLTVGGLSLDLTTHRCWRDAKAISLNPSEYLLLKLLMQASPGVVSRQHISETLWSDEPPDSDVIRIHIYQLRGKIDKPFDCALIRTVHGVGYRLCESGD